MKKFRLKNVKKIKDCDDSEKEEKIQWIEIFNKTMKKKEFMSNCEIISSVSLISYYSTRDIEGLS